MLSKAKIKFITSLKLKKHRNEQQLFIAEGEKIVREFLQSSSFVREVYATEAWITSNSNLIARTKTAAEVITEQELRKISMLTTPHNVLAICSIPNVTYTEGNIKQELCLALDNIQDPGNMGTIIRIADWFNIPFVFCSEDCVDIYNPKVVQSSMGSIARVNVVETDLEKLFSAHPDIQVMASVLNGRNIFEMEKADSGFILIGNESSGIKANLVQMASKKITIPRIGAAESLNAAVAAGIICAVFKNK